MNEKKDGFEQNKKKDERRDPKGSREVDGFDRIQWILRVCASDQDLLLHFYPAIVEQAKGSLISRATSKKTMANCRQTREKSE